MRLNPCLLAIVLVFSSCKGAGGPAGVIPPPDDTIHIGTDPTPDITADIPADNPDVPPDDSAAQDIKPVDAPPVEVPPPTDTPIDVPPLDVPPPDIQVPDIGPPDGPQQDAPQPDAPPEDIQAPEIPIDLPIDVPSPDLAPDETAPDPGEGAQPLDPGQDQPGLDITQSDPIEPDSQAPEPAVETVEPDPGPPPPGLCSGVKLPAWSRKSRTVGGAVVFTEVMYEPAGGPQWIEMHNPMSIDIDMSGWRLAGDIAFTFPEGSFLSPGGYTVVAADPDGLAKASGFNGAFGPFQGALAGKDAVVELRNNSDRLMDSVHHGTSEPWPVTPAGSGASMAKTVPTAPSEAAESWTGSDALGGTPGKANSAPPPAPPKPMTLVAMESEWRYDAGGKAPAAGWNGTGFDDSTWPAAPATFWAGAPPPAVVNATASVTADNFFALYVGHADGTGMKLIGRDSISDWTSVEQFAIDVSPDDRLYMAAWEAPAGDQGPQMLIGQVDLPGGKVVATSDSTFEWVIGPTSASPGGALSDPAPPVSVVQGLAQAAEQAKSWIAPAVQAEKTTSPWGWAVAGSLSGPAMYIWADTFASLSITNSNQTYALFRTTAPLVAGKGQTELPQGVVTAYFRTEFEFSGDPGHTDLWMDALVDDGAVTYLNGVEVLRLNIPDGAVDDTTLASQAVGEPSMSQGLVIPAGSLVKGTNVLAVEVHQAGVADQDMAFGARLFARVWPEPGSTAGEGVVFNEVAAGGTKPFWIEIANGGDQPVDVGGLVVGSSAGLDKELSPQVLPQGQVLLLGQDDLGFDVAVGDRLFLYSKGLVSVLDGVEVTGMVRGRASPGRGRWLHPDKATPGTANQFVLHDEVVINEVMYHQAPIIPDFGQAVESEEEWIELLNRSDHAVDISGWQIADAAEFEFPAGTTIPAGGYIVAAWDAIALKAAFPEAAVVGNLQGGLDNAGENILLRDTCGNPVDEVRYLDGGRWPGFADGGGSSLELRDPRADNTSPEAWAASDEGVLSSWNEYVYGDIAAASPVGPDGQWSEFLMGLLDDGVVLVDDVSVIEDPDGAAIELIQDGKFESGGAKGWRIIGNHRHSEVVPDPDDPSNHVLKLVATGSTEHMHNHAETTLAGGAKVQNGKKYRTAFRARWVAGSNRLNTRLYFNRAARTTLVPRPEKHGTPGAINSAYSDNIGPTYTDFAHSPAVPSPSEPVFVTVAAGDPDGVADVTLRYSVAGGPFVETPMVDGGGGRYSAVVPGQPAGTVVQFWVEGKDLEGAASTFPAAGAGSRALWKVDDGKAATNGLHNLRIIMTPADSDWFHAPINVMSNDHVGATLVYDETEVFYDVGVRAKGSERGRPMVPRLGFDLDLNADQPFRGVYDDIMLDRSEGVIFGQREMLMNQVLTHAGSVFGEYNDLVQLMTPRPEHTGPAELQLARFGDLLLNKQFEKGGDGGLFEYELIYYPTTTDNGTPEGNKLPQPDLVIGTAIKDLGPDREAYRHSYIIKNNRWRDDFQKLIEFAKVFGQAGALFEQQIGLRIDVDQWLRSFAFASLSGCVDNYGTGAQHNAEFYVRPGDGRVLYFAHDMDFYPGSPASAVVSSGDLKKLLFSPGNQRMFYGHLYDVIGTTYNGTYMAHWCNQLGQLLPAQPFASHCQFISQRATHVMETAGDSILKTFPKCPFEITTNGGADFSIAGQQVTLEGTAWIDVREIRLAGDSKPLPVTWIGKTQWQVALALACGLNLIALEAKGFHESDVGEDSIVVTGSCNE